MATKTLERLQVLLTADDSNLKGTLGKASGKLGGFTDKLRGIGRAAAPVAGAVAAIGGAAVGAALKAGRMADELLDLSEQTGLTTDQLQEFRRVTNQAGVETDTIARAAEQMTLRMSRGAEGSADLRQGLEQLGISAKDAEGNIRPMSEIVDEAIVGLAEMDNVTERNVLATKLFSRGASDLAPVLGLGADEIQRLREEAGELGLVIGKDALEDANRFRQSWDGVKQELGGVVSQVGIDLVPTLQNLADKIQGSWRPAIEKVADSFVFVVESAVGFGDNLKRIWIGIQGITLAAVQAIINAVASLGERIPFLGDKIAVLGDKFDQWANVQMVNLRAQMAAVDQATADVGTTTAQVTSTIDDSTAAFGRNAAAAGEMAEAHTQAANNIAEAHARIQEALAGSQMSSGLTREQLIGDAGDVETEGGGAYIRTASTISASAFKVLGAVQRVLAKLTGGGGIFGGITGAIGGFLSGGPLGAALGFGGGIGLFAEGGTISAGSIGIVGERGPEIVSGPATVTPTNGLMLRIDPSSIPPAPRVESPEAAALSAWYRQLFSALVFDGKTRGVL